MVQHLIKVAKGTINNPEIVRVYTITNGIVSYHMDFVDWLSATEMYPDGSFIDMFDVGMHRIGETLGFFPEISALVN
jgi:hypothetical protein